MGALQYASGRVGGEDLGGDEGPRAQRVRTQKAELKRVFPKPAPSGRLPGFVSDLISHYLGESAWESPALTRAQVTPMTEQFRKPAYKEGQG